MRKLILILSAVVCTLMASAQGWQVTDDQAYDGEHVIYATIDGMTQNDDYIVGAFIDGICRASEPIKRDVNGTASDPLRFELRVKGGIADAGKDITFKVMSGQYEYTLAQTLAYEHEGITGMPSNLYKLNFVKATSYSFKQTTVDLYIGSTYDIEYTVTPAGAQLPDGFDDMFQAQQVASIISVVGKKVTAIQTGYATVSNEAGVQLSGSELTINVVDRPISVESITINQELTNIIYVEDEIVINPYFSVNPHNASNQNVTVTASNNNVTITESVDEEGIFILKADAKGTSVVTITSEENPSISAQITFTIKQHVGYIYMNQQADFQLTVGQTINLADYYVIGPDDADNKAVTVTVDCDAATVNGSGENWTLTANNAGRAIVTVTSLDNPELEVILYFTIVQHAQSITVTPNTFDITVGETITFGTDVTVTISPAEAAQDYALSTVNTDIVQVNDAAVAAANIVGLAAGTATVTVTTTDGSRKSADITVNVYPALTGFTVDNESLTLSSHANSSVITITPVPANALLKDELSFTITGPANLPQGWKYVEGDLTENNGIYTLTLTPYCMGEGTVNLTYGSGTIAVPSVALHIGYEYNLAAGWNWVSTFSDGTSRVAQTMDQMLGNKLVEARTQDGLLYNDPKYGYFGDFTDFGTTAPKFYKVKTNTAVSYMLFGSYNAAASADLRTGWSWIPYTCEYDQEIALAGKEGDVILSLTDGMATYNDGVWAPATFALKAGQGYLYFTTTPRTMQLPSPYSCEQIKADPQANAPARERSHWSYNPHLHNSIMPMIAKIDGFDSDNYTVGAFVGDECRGAGRLVDGKWFITVAGEDGEEVSFRIYDKSTGLTTDVNTTVMMSSIIGTAKAPVALQAAENGVSSIRAIDIDLDSTTECYDLFGRRVSHPTSGMYIINGKKVIVK